MTQWQDRDRTAQTEPLTTGQQIVAKWEGLNGWTEPADLAQGIDDAIAAARSAALEEAAAEMEHRVQVATTAHNSYLMINSPHDAARQDHYRVAYGSGAAAIRELKDKSPTVA
jgi:hypothetical protein